MPKANDAKIRLGRSLTVCLVSIALLLVLAFLLVNRQEDNKPEVMLGDRLLNLEVADTEAERVQGLSDRKSLGTNNAMLFVFPDVNEECMWMKDMRFALDIVWLNNSKQIVKMVQKISPDTYPQTFCSPNTKYVLELSAGSVQKYGLKTGQRLNF